MVKHRSSGAAYWLGNRDLGALGSVMVILKRLARALLTLFVVVTVVFVATRLSGDPTQHLLPPNSSEAELAELRALLGLDQSLLTQYGYYLRNIAQGEFGVSFFSRRPVVEMYAERLPNTLHLMVPSLLLAIAIGGPIGLVAALKPNTVVDRSLMAFSFVGQATPNFALGIALILVFSFALQWLPSSGTGGWPHYVMPVVTLGTATAASISRLTRSSMLDVLGQDYMRYARSKGLSEATVVLKHGLRNGMLPVLTILGLQVGTLVGGAVVVEAVFAWPGAGRLLVDAVLQRDYAVLQFGVLVVAATVILANLLVDVSYGLLDPRVREAQAA